MKKRLSPTASIHSTEQSFSLEKELSESMATVTVSAANSMIALSTGKAKSKHSKDKADSGKEKKSHKYANAQVI